MRPIDADKVLETMRSNMDMQELYLPTHFIDLVIDNMPTIEAEPDNDWISVEDRLPEPKTWVMVYIEYPSPVFEIERGIQKMSNIKKMFYDGKSFHYDFGAITYWQPLPEPPKGE